VSGVPPAPRSPSRRRPPLSGPRYVYAGTAPFAELVLAGLLRAGRAPVAVLTSPDRPKGRHGTPQPPGVKVAALQRGLPFLQPEAVSSPNAVRELLSFEPQVLAVCAYGQIVAQDLLDELPAVVVHPSLVPRWRGAAPVERALMAGETELGVTTLKMTAGVDEGPVGDTRLVHVPADADAGRAYELLAPAAVDGLIATLDGVAAGTVRWAEQRGTPSYADKIGADDKIIDWTRAARDIVNQIRALSPHIGAVTELLGTRTRVWRAAVGEGPQPEPGPARLALPAGDGWVDVFEVQQDGRARVSAAEFLRGAGRALASRPAP
jgi:methionyl-tRNA formyltransferase